MRALDWGELGATQLYLVMDLVEGARTLDLVSGSLPERLGRLRAAAALVAHAHGAGVIHRDLKPSNFLVGSDGQVRLADFGLAKARGEVEPEATAGLTLTGIGMGTAPYMPPEQFDDVKTVDERADVYALGVMLFLALTKGKLPFEGSASALLQKQLRVREGRAPLPRPRDHDASVAAALDALCASAIALDRAQRLPSATALVAGIDSYLSPETVPMIERQGSSELEPSMPSLGRTVAGSPPTIPPRPVGPPRPDLPGPTTPPRPPAPPVPPKVVAPVKSSSSVLGKLVYVAWVVGLIFFARTKLAVSPPPPFSPIPPVKIESSPLSPGQPPLGSWTSAKSTLQGRVVVSTRDEAMRGKLELGPTGGLPGCYVEATFSGNRIPDPSPPVRVCATNFDRSIEVVASNQAFEVRNESEGAVTLEQWEQGQLEAPVRQELPRDGRARFSWGPRSCAGTITLVQPTRQVLHVIVTDNRYYSITDRDGGYTIPDAPAGELRVRLWHPYLDDFLEETVHVGAGDITLGSGVRWRASPWPEKQ